MPWKPSAGNQVEGMLPPTQDSSYRSRRWLQCPESLVQSAAGCAGAAQPQSGVSECFCTSTDPLPRSHAPTTKFLLSPTLVTLPAKDASTGLVNWALEPNGVHRG